MTRLRVLFLTAWYPTAEQPVGGIFVREHAKAVNLYDDVVVVHLAGMDPAVPRSWAIDHEPDSEFTEGIPTYRVRHGRPAPKTSLALYLVSALAAYRRVTADGSKPDVIHAHVYTAGVAAVFVGALRRVPVVITEQYSAVPLRLLGRREVLLAKLAFKLAGRVLPISQALHSAVEAYGIRGDFRVVPNAVDVELFRPPETTTLESAEKQLLFVGLLGSSHVKGVPYLLQALARLRETRDDWRLDLVGDGPVRSQYERLASHLRLAGKVAFHGRASKRRIAQMLREADLLVLPSVCETFGCVLIEARASGQPVRSPARSAGFPKCPTRHRRPGSSPAASRPCRRYREDDYRLAVL